MSPPDEEEPDEHIDLFPDPRVGEISESGDRFILEMSDGITDEDLERIHDTDLELVHVLEHVGYIIVRGSESEVQRLPYEYRPDLRFERQGK